MQYMQLTKVPACERRHGVCLGLAGSSTVASGQLKSNMLLTVCRDVTSTHFSHTTGMAWYVARAPRSLLGSSCWLAAGIACCLPSDIAPVDAPCTRLPTTSHQIACLGWSSSTALAP